MRGAAEGTDLVEYYVECDLVARALDNDRIRCIQKISHINPPGKPRFLANMPSCTIASFIILIAFLEISELSHMDYPDTAFELDQVECKNVSFSLTLPTYANKKHMMQSK